MVLLDQIDSINCDCRIYLVMSRIFDPCYAATAILSATYEDSVLDRDKWPEILRNIIAGYDAVVRLTEAERAAIPYMIYSIQMTCIAFFLGI